MNIIGDQAIQNRECNNRGTNYEKYYKESMLTISEPVLTESAVKIKNSVERLNLFGKTIFSKFGEEEARLRIWNFLQYNHRTEQIRFLQNNESFKTFLILIKGKKFKGDKLRSLQFIKDVMLIKREVERVAIPWLKKQTKFMELKLAQNKEILLNDLSSLKANIEAFLIIRELQEKTLIEKETSPAPFPVLNFWKEKRRPITYETKTSKIERTKIALEEVGDRRLYLLLNHPEGWSLLEKLRSSDYLGKNALNEEFNTALIGLERFRSELENNPGHLWRYPPLIIGTLKELLSEVQEKFDNNQYFLEIMTLCGKRISETAWDKLKDVAGMLLLIFSGLSLIGVGFRALFISLVDFSLASFSTWKDFEKAYENNLGFDAQAFSNEKVFTFGKQNYLPGTIDIILAFAGVYLDAFELIKFNRRRLAKSVVKKKSTRLKEMESTWKRVSQGIDKKRRDILILNEHHKKLKKEIKLLKRKIEFGTPNEQLERSLSKTESLGEKVENRIKELKKEEEELVRIYNVIRVEIPKLENELSTQASKLIRDKSISSKAILPKEYADLRGPASNVKDWLNQNPELEKLPKLLEKWYADKTLTPVKIGKKFEEFISKLKIGDYYDLNLIKTNMPFVDGKLTLPNGEIRFIQITLGKPKSIVKHMNKSLGQYLEEINSKLFMETMEKIGVGKNYYEYIRNLVFILPKNQALELKQFIFKKVPPTATDLESLGTGFNIWLKAKFSGTNPSIEQVLKTLLSEHIVPAG